MLFKLRFRVDIDNSKKCVFLKLNPILNPIPDQKIQMKSLQPRTQASTRYPSDQRRLGTDHDSEFSRQA